MTRQRRKLAWIVNENSRKASLKKKWAALEKKLMELTTLCDVKACLIAFGFREAEPLVWPTVETARDLLDKFFALSEIEKKRKETTLESYFKEKIKKLNQKLMKLRQKNMEYLVNQLMGQVFLGRRIEDFNLSEIYDLLSFSKEKIMLYRKRLNLLERPPLPEPPRNPFEAPQPEESMTIRNDVFMVTADQVDEGTRATDEASRMISSGSINEKNHNYYLTDIWHFPSLVPPNPWIHQRIGMGMIPNNGNPNTGSNLSNQGSN